MSTAGENRTGLAREADRPIDKGEKNYTTGDLETVDLATTGKERGDFAPVFGIRYNRGGSRIKSVPRPGAAISGMAAWR
jgi:hypothetical protein